MKGGKSPKNGGTGKKQAGVWNRGRGKGPANPIRVRTKRLDEIDSDKIALAYWLLAKQIVEDRSEQRLNEREVRRVAKQLDYAPPNGRNGSGKDARAKRGRG